MAAGDAEGTSHHSKCAEMCTMGRGLLKGCLAVVDRTSSQGCRNDYQVSPALKWGFGWWCRPWLLRVVESWDNVTTWPLLHNPIYRARASLSASCRPNVGSDEAFMRNLHMQAGPLSITEAVDQKSPA
jgi:hypothetical protein